MHCNIVTCTEFPNFLHELVIVVIRHQRSLTKHRTGSRQRTSRLATQTQISLITKVHSNKYKTKAKLWVPTWTCWKIHVMSHLVTSGSRQDPNAVLGRLSVRCKEFIYNMESYKTHWVAREEGTQNRGHGSKEQNFKHEDQGGASKKKWGTQQYI